MADNKTTKEPTAQQTSIPVQAAPKKAAQPAPAKAKAAVPNAAVKKTANPPKAAPKKAGNSNAVPSSAKKIAAQPKAPAKVDKSCSGRWKTLTGCDKFNVFWYLFWLSPFLIEGSVWLIVLGALIPIGFGFGLIKHKAPILWFIIAFIVNVGGLADLTADIWLLLRTLLYYMTSYKVDPFGDLTPEERSLVFIRMIVTLVTGVPSVIFLFFMNSTAWEKLTGEKKANVARSGNAAAAIIMMIIWKLAMIFARITIIWKILGSLIKHKKITKETEKETQFWEIAATLEVLWSAIPLGILTALEAFYFEDISHVTPNKIWEFIKLGALAVDLIGVSFFCYFELFGLNKKVGKCLGEHDHHEASINQAADEKAPLIVDQTSNILKPSDSNV